MTLTRLPFPGTDNELLEAGRVRLQGPLVPKGHPIGGDTTTGQISGISLGDGTYVARGPVSMADWSDVIGAVQLEVNKNYFLTESNGLSIVPAQTGYIIRVGTARTEKTLDVTLDLKVRL